MGHSSPPFAAASSSAGLSCRRRPCAGAMGAGHKGVGMLRWSSVVGTLGHTGYRGRITLRNQMAVTFLTILSTEFGTAGAGAWT